ncbi:MAG TPA: Holliday junction branch migration protein RuvA, partial [Chitinophagaceae bacterium]|nr:Holliday junction branch migration protein RuvA [Chitinophagaceae bacterium]
TGYEVNISLHTYSSIQHLESGRLLTHLQIKEDGHVLFGFHEHEERNLFLQLISVNGIGTSTARMMLSSMKPEEITHAIQHGDEAMLGRIKGIGPKSAKRLILELKDKLGKAGSSTNIEVQKSNIPSNDALFALMNLGINRNTAQQAIEKVLQQDAGLSLEELIKQALKNI